MSSHEIVREAGPEVAAEVIALIRRVFEEYGFVWEPETEVADLLDFGRHYVAPHGTFFVARAQGGVVGSVGVHRLDDGRGELKRMYVDPRQRRQGVGQALAEAALAWARAEGLREIVLWSDTRFDRAHRLYERLGWVRTGERVIDNDPNDSREYGYRRPL
jgi:GNAT superfamily N-acetyltransferase